jgi:hypothetical protein
MPDYTLKNIPPALYRRLQSAAEGEFRSLNQEILARLSRSFDAQDAKMSAVHARWVHEALNSGSATVLKKGELDKAFERGISQARARKKSEAA